MVENPRGCPTREGRSIEELPSTVTLHTSARPLGHHAALHKTAAASRPGCSTSVPRVILCTRCPSTRCSSTSSTSSRARRGYASPRWTTRHRVKGNLVQVDHAGQRQNLSTPSPVILHKEKSQKRGRDLALQAEGGDPHRQQYEVAIQAVDGGRSSPASPSAPCGRTSPPSATAATCPQAQVLGEAEGGQEAHEVRRLRRDPQEAFLCDPQRWTDTTPPDGRGDRTMNEPSWRDRLCTSPRHPHPAVLATALVFGLSAVKVIARPRKPLALAPGLRGFEIVVPRRARPDLHVQGRRRGPASSRTVSAEGREAPARSGPPAGGGSPREKRRARRASAGRSARPSKRAQRRRRREGRPRLRRADHEAPQARPQGTVRSEYVR